MRTVTLVATGKTTQEAEDRLYQQAEQKELEPLGTIRIVEEDGTFFASREYVRVR